MTRFESLLDRVSKLQGRVNEVETKLSIMVETHLGDGWYVTYDRGDGHLLGSPAANNYRISDYLEVQHKPREEAIEYILDHPFN